MSQIYIPYKKTVRAVYIILRIIKDPFNFVLRQDEIIPKFSNIDLVYKTDDGSIYDLKDSNLAEIKYDIIKNHSMYNGYNYPQQMQYNIPPDYNAIESYTYNILNNDDNLFFNDVKVNSINIISPYHGYFNIPINNLYERLSDNTIQQVTCYPEIDYIYYTNNNIHHLTINMEFTDYDILDHNIDLNFNNQTYLIHSFGYTLDYSMKVRINSIVLYSTKDTSLHVCKLKNYLIIGKPISYSEKSI